MSPGETFARDAERAERPERMKRFERGCTETEQARGDRTDIIIVENWISELQNLNGWLGRVCDETFSSGMRQLALQLVEPVQNDVDAGRVAG